MSSLIDLPSKALAKIQTLAERGAAELHYLQKLIGFVFFEAMQRVVRAFEKRAEQLYGTPR